MENVVRPLRYSCGLVRWGETVRRAILGESRRGRGMMRATSGPV